MPALPPTPSPVLKFIFGGTLDVSAWANIMYFEYTGGAPSNTNCSSLASGALTAYNTNILPTITNQCALRSCEVIDVSSVTGGVGSATINVTGIDSSAPVGNNVSILVSHKIARRYRGGKPRTYFPPSGSNNLTLGNVWASSMVSTFQTGFNAFIAAIVGSTAGTTVVSSHCNVSYYQGFTNVTDSSGRMRAKPTVRATPLVDVVTSSVVESLVATQRRRDAR